MKLGIDVSENNGEVDFEAVAAAGVKFVMVRASYGQHEEDSRFVENVEKAHAAGLVVGAYHYGYALNPRQAMNEAINCQRVIEKSGLLLEMPVFYDMEDDDKYKERHGFIFDIEHIDPIVQAFLKRFELHSGIYASEDWLGLYIVWEETQKPVWCASWPYKKEYLAEGLNDEALRDLAKDDPFGGWLWQFTDKLRIGDKLFDGNILYE